MKLSRVRQIFGCISFFLVWIVTDHAPPWNTFFQEMLMAFTVLLLWPWGSLSVWPKRLILAAIAWLIVNILQYFFGRIGFGDLFLSASICTLFSMAASLGGQSALAKSSKVKKEFEASYLEYCCGILLAAALFNAIVGFAQWQGVAYGLLMLESAGRSYGNFAQPNHYATLLVLGLIALASLQIEERVRKGWSILGGAILIVALIGSESRTGILSLNVVVLAIFLLRKKEGIRDMARQMYLLLALSWLVFFAWSPISDYLGGTVTRSAIGLSTSTRFELWSQMLAAIQLRPWLGYGWLQLGEAQNAVAHVIGGTVNMSSAHNIFVDILVWYGVPLGAVMIFCLIIWMLGVFINVLLKECDCKIAICALMLIPIGVHSMLEYPLFYLYFLLVFAFFAGFLDVSMGHAGKVSKSFHLFGVTFGFVGIIVALYVALEYIQVEQDFRELRLERDFGRSIEEPYRYHFSSVILDQYGWLVYLMSKDPTDDILSEHEDEVRRLVFRFPWLMTYEYYYVFLVSNQQCIAAGHQYKVIESLFGKFGMAKARDAVERYGVSAECS